MMKDKSHVEALVKESYTKKSLFSSGEVVLLFEMVLKICAHPAVIEG
jgi:hypothetical protein